jgi:hypothetical protein
MFTSVKSTCYYVPATVHFQGDLWSGQYSFALILPFLEPAPPVAHALAQAALGPVPCPGYKTVYGFHGFYVHPKSVS